MKAIISSTYSDTYLFFLPIITFLWNKLGVDVICFMPTTANDYNHYKFYTVISKYLKDFKCQIQSFDAPEHKAATYAQCARLYAACLDLPEDEILVTGDIDMLVFKQPPYYGGFTIWGTDLVPAGQFPICYISAKVKDWRQAFQIQYGSLSAEKDAVAQLWTKSYQQCLDELLGDIECEHFRSNQWSKDQELAFNKISAYPEVHHINRSNGENQFAMHRVDRTDDYWRDRLSKSLIDAHLWRPGYEETSFNNILELLQYMYPEEDFKWLREYRNKYIELL